MYAPTTRRLALPAPSDTTVPAPPVKPNHPMEVVCHGCKQPAKSEDDDRCSLCGKWLVRRADLAIWSRTRPICIIAVIAFAIFCWATGAHRANSALVTTVACVCGPMLFTAWMLKSQAPTWMHPFTHNEISLSVGLGMGLPVAAILTFVMMPPQPEELRAALAHGQPAGSKYVITPPEATPATVAGAALMNSPEKPDPTESELLGNSAADLLASLPSQGDALRAELDAAGIRKMLYASSLADPKRIKAARTRIPKVDAHLATVDTARRTALSQFPAKVNAATSMSDKEKADMLYRARWSARAVVQRWTEYVALHRKLLHETDAALAQIQSMGPSRYSVENNQIRFARAADSKSFAQRLKRLADLWPQLDNTLRLLHGASGDAGRSLKSAPTTSP